LIEKESREWKFADFNVYLRAKDPLFLIYKSIFERHGKIKNIKIYKNEYKKEN